MLNCENIERYGFLTQLTTGQEFPLTIMKSAAGYFIGTQSEFGPNRESVEYFTTAEKAEQALLMDSWTQRRSV